MPRKIILVVLGFTLVMLGLFALLINPFILKTINLKGDRAVIYIDESVSMHPEQKRLKSYLRFVENNFKDKVRLYGFSSAVRALSEQKYEPNQEVSLYHPILKHTDYLPEKVPVLVFSDLAFYDRFLPLERTNAYYFVPRKKATDRAVFINRSTNEVFYQLDETNAVEILVMKNTPEPETLTLEIVLKDENGATLDRATKSVVLEGNIQSVSYAFSKLSAKELLLVAKLKNNNDSVAKNDEDRFVFRRSGSQLRIHSWIFKATEDIQKIHNKIRPYSAVEFLPKYFLNPMVQVAKANKSLESMSSTMEDIFLLFSPPKEVVELFRKGEKFFFLIPQNVPIANNNFYTDIEAVQDYGRRLEFNSSFIQKFITSSSIGAALGTSFLNELKPFESVVSMPFEEKNALLFSSSPTQKPNYSPFFMQGNMVFMGFYPIHHMESSDKSEAINLLDHLLQQMFITLHKEYVASLENEAPSGNYLLGSVNVPRSVLRMLKVPGKQAQIPGDLRLAGLHTARQSASTRPFRVNVRIPYKEFFSFTTDSPRNMHLFEEAETLTKDILGQMKPKTTTRKIPIEQYPFLYIAVFAAFVLFAVMRSLYKNVS